jgi:hypothetical protein
MPSITGLQRMFLTSCWYDVIILMNWTGSSMWLVCVKFDLWSSFPIKELRIIFASYLNPGFSLILSYSSIMPSFFKYCWIYCCLSFSCLHQSGQPLASCLTFRNVLTYSVNSPPVLDLHHYWAISSNYQF